MKIIILMFITITITIATSINAKNFDDSLLETCAAFIVITEAIAEESYNKNVAARDTDMYKKFRHVNAEIAEHLANDADLFRGLVKPSLVSAILGYECRGIDMPIRGKTGKTMISIFGNACNSAPTGTETECIDKYLNDFFQSRTPEIRQKALNEAKELFNEKKKEIEKLRRQYESTNK